MFGIQAKNDEMKRAVWLSPKGTTRLRIHASMWKTREAAEESLAKIQELNPTIAFAVKPLS